LILGAPQGVIFRGKVVLGARKVLLVATQGFPAPPKVVLSQGKDVLGADKFILIAPKRVLRVPELVFFGGL
jgi:hypothetical protein